jgi:hypothetical protein
MSVTRRVLVTAAVLAGLATTAACTASPGAAPASGPAASAPSAAGGSGTPAALAAVTSGTPATAAACPAPGSYLTAVRAGRQPAVDRVVFQFAGRPPTSYSVAWVSQVVADGSGKPVPVAGHAFLRVTFRGATAVCPANGRKTYTGPQSLAPGFTQLRGLVAAGDFEGYLSWGVGLTKKASYHAYTLTGPARVVIDLSR